MKRGERNAGRKRGPQAWVLDGRGNRTVLVPALSRRLVEFARRGHWPQLVAIECRVTPETLRGWLERGAEPAAIEPYKTFAEEFLEAEAANCAELQDVLTDAALGRVSAEKGKPRPDVDTARWLLERRYAFLWRGGGVAAMAQVAMSSERGLREKAEQYLRQLPAPQQDLAREMGFMLPSDAPGES